MGTTQHRSRDSHSKGRPLVAVGIVLVLVGAYSVVTLFWSSFGRYMYIEDLGLNFDEDTVFAITRLSPADKTLLVAAGLQITLGIVLGVAGAVRWRRAYSKRFTIASAARSM